MTITPKQKLTMQKKETHRGDTPLPDFKGGLVPSINPIFPIHKKIPQKLCFSKKKLKKKIDLVFETN